MNHLILREFIAHVLNNEMDSYTLDDQFLNTDTHLQDSTDDENYFGPVPPNESGPSVCIDPYVKGDGTEIRDYVVS